jgi:ATP-dependent RNA helicase DeaD
VKIEQKAMTVPTVEQVYYEVDRRYKMELLTRLIDLYDMKLGIIFCNTKRMVDDLVDHLEAAGYQADRLHGDMTQAHARPRDEQVPQVGPGISRGHGCRGARH